MKKILHLLNDRQFMKKVLFIAIPIMLQQMLTSSVNLLDNLMVGQLGDYAISGVAAANRFFSVGTFGMMGIITASSIFIAQYYGAKQHEHIQQSFRYSIVASLLVIMPFVLAGLLIPAQVAGFFNPDPQLADLVSRYMPLAALTFVPQALSLSVGSAMRSLGNTKLPLYSSVIALFANAFLNYVFIFGHFGFPELGVLGAALGTLIARFIELGFLLLMLKNNDFAFKTRIVDMFKIEKHVIKTITLRGVPLVINEILWAGGHAVLFKFYATRGTFVMSAMAILQTTSDLFFVLFAGMASATTIMVAQPLGSNKLDLAKENAWKMFAFATLLSLFFALGLFGASFIVPGLYNISDDIHHLATTMIRIQAGFFWIYMLNAQSYFTLRAGGDMMNTLILDAGFMWCVNIVVVGSLAYFTNVSIFVLFIAGQLTDIIKLMISLRFVKQERWVKNLTHVEI